MTDPRPRPYRADRRSFLLSTGAVAATGVLPVRAQDPEPDQDDPPPAAPPAEPAAAPAPGAPGITPATIAEAEKLAGVTYTDEERETIIASIESQLARAARRRSTPLANGDAPAQVFDPRPRGAGVVAEQRPLRARRVEAGPVPSGDEDIAFAPVSALGQWIARRELTSTRLTEIYLERLERIGPGLESVVTLTRDRARRQAERADRESAAGRLRGPLHGIPWGAKDLLDTAGVRTTWGATPFRDRVPATDAVVVRRLEEAGAVLVAKLTLGALAYGDIWFDGKTRNPWNREQGSSGSSAGSAASTVAGLVGFSLGTETLGSIVSPCMRCGATGLRPTFGRVARTGAMALCWSLDKIGPICRTVEDTALVLSALNGADAGDPSSVNMPFNFDAGRPVEGLRVGFDPRWFEGEREPRALDRRALAAARETGLELVEIELPDRPYGTLMTILLAEAAAAFEELTLSGDDDTLVWQDPDAWPNTFRRTRFVPAVEYVQAERFRRQVMTMMAGQFENLDAMLSPSYAGSLLLITNNTGHPSLTIRTGFKDDGTPHGITLWGRLFDEGTLCRIGMALEERLDVWSRRPPAAPAS